MSSELDKSSIREERTERVAVVSVIAALRKQENSSELPPEDNFMKELGALLSLAELDVDSTLVFFRSLEEEDLADVLIAMELYFRQKATAYLFKYEMSYWCLITALKIESSHKRPEWRIPTVL